MCQIHPPASPGSVLRLLTAVSSSRIRYLRTSDFPTLQRQFPDHILEYRDADAWFGRHLHRSVPLDSERLADALGLEIPRGRGHVAGNAEVRKGSQVHVMGTADAHLEHSAAPHGHVLGGANVVYA